MSVPIETNEYVAYLRHVRDVIEDLPDAVVPSRDKHLVRELVGLETTRMAPRLRSLERTVDAVHASVLAAPERNEATVRNIASTLSALHCVWLVRGHAKHCAHLLLLDVIRENAACTDLVVRIMRVIEDLNDDRQEDAVRGLDALDGFMSKHAPATSLMLKAADRLKAAAVYARMLAG